MDLSKLSGNIARQLLCTMLAKGELTPQQVKASLIAEPNVEIKRIADFVHQLLCMEHGKGGVSTCNYYHEEKEVNPFAGSEHQKWLNMAMDMMEKHDLSSEEAFRTVFGEAVKVNKQILQLKESFPVAHELLLKMNGWNEPK